MNKKCKIDSLYIFIDGRGIERCAKCGRRVMKCYPMCVFDKSYWRHISRRKK